MTTKTALFAYIGTDKRGRESRGEIEATSISMVKAQLRKRGITAKSVRKKSKPLFRGRGATIKAADIALFTRQLATMMKAGVPLIQSFEIVADGIENPRMQKLVNAVRSDVASGNALAGALARHPEQFDDLFCSLVASGESSGTLETMLDRVATYKEKTEQLKAKIKKALTYPIAIMAVAMVVTALLLVKVVPQFAETFQSFGAELPAFTQLSSISRILRKTTTCICSLLSLRWCTSFAAPIESREPSETRWIILHSKYPSSGVSFATRPLRDSLAPSRPLLQRVSL